MRFKGELGAQGVGRAFVLRNSRQLVTDGRSALQLTKKGELYFSERLDAAPRLLRGGVAQVAFCGRYFALTEGREIVAVDRFGAVSETGVGVVCIEVIKLYAVFRKCGAYFLFQSQIVYVVSERRSYKKFHAKIVYSLCFLA